MIQKKFIPKCPFGKKREVWFPGIGDSSGETKIPPKKFLRPSKRNETKPKSSVFVQSHPEQNRPNERRRKKTACTIRLRFDLSFGDTTINTIQRYDVDTNVGSVPRSTWHLKVSLKPGIIEILKKLFAIRNSLTEEILEIEISSFEKMFILWLSVKLSTAELHLKPKEFQQKHSFQNKPLHRICK